MANLKGVIKNEAYILEALQQGIRGNEESAWSRIPWWLELVIANHVLEAKYNNTRNSNWYIALQF